MENVNTVKTSRAIPLIPLIALIVAFAALYFALTAHQNACAARHFAAQDRAAEQSAVQRAAAMDEVRREESMTLARLGLQG